MHYGNLGVPILNKIKNGGHLRTKLHDRLLQETCLVWLFGLAVGDKLYYNLLKICNEY